MRTFLTYDALCGEGGLFNQRDAFQQYESYIMTDQHETLVKAFNALINYTRRRRFVQVL